MIKIEPLICEQCGGAIDRRTMKCLFCDTQYERKNNGVTLNYVVEQPGTHRIRAQVRIDKRMMADNPERATAYTLDKMRQEIADGLLGYMKITTAEDFEFGRECQIIRGEVRVIDPEFRMN